MAIQKQRVVFFETKITDFFRKSGRETLPWRKPKMDAYQVWVSEIMLQQTQVSRVISYYERFLKRFPTVKDLSRASWEEFLPYYEGLGYYARGRNMLRTAQKVMEEHGGVFPKSEKELLALPGIGQYTASAIRSFAYGESALAWDTNLTRVIGRFFYGSRQAEIERDFFENKLQGGRKNLNAALMDFGSALCVTRPQCGACMLSSKCLYFQSDGAKEVVVKKTSVKGFRENDASAVVFLHKNHRDYYSSKKNRYEPFIVEAGSNDRAGIKSWFLKKYGLKLSVRPPHKKIVLEGQPYMYVNAQVLAGRVNFEVFSKKARAEYTKKREEKAV